MADSVNTGTVGEGQQANLKLIKDTLEPMVAEVIEAKLAKLNEPKPTDKLVDYRGREITADGPIPKGHGVARCIRYLAAANNDVRRAIDLAHRAGEKDLCDKWDKAMASTVLADGGALIPTEFSQEIIEELGAKAVLRKMSVTTMPMNTGSLCLPYLDTSATAYYVGENSNITASQPTTAQLQLSDKTLSVLCPLSNTLLQNGGPKVDSAIKNHLLRVAARKEDVTFIRSTGTANTPMGLRYQALAANQLNVTASYDVTKVTLDLGRAIKTLMALDVDLDGGGAGWLLPVSVYNYLHSACDANSNRVWRDEMDKGVLEGFPYAVTSQIPENISTTKTEVYFVNFKSCVIAESENMEVAVFPGGSYYDGSNVVSGISLNQTVIRLLARHDFGCMYRGNEIAVYTDVDWGD